MNKELPYHLQKINEGMGEDIEKQVLDIISGEFARKKKEKAELEKNREFFTVSLSKDIQNCRECPFLHCQQGHGERLYYCPSKNVTLYSHNIEEGGIPKECEFIKRG